jgi:hypothetical protein
MKYEWENDIEADYLQEIISDGDMALPGNVRVVGVVVADMDNIEGAFIPAGWFAPSGLEEADIALDAMGDLDRLRLEALRVAGLWPQAPGAVDG